PHRFQPTLARWLPEQGAKLLFGNLVECLNTEDRIGELLVPWEVVPAYIEMISEGKPVFDRCEGFVRIVVRRADYSHDRGMLLRTPKHVATRLGNQHSMAL